MGFSNKWCIATSTPVNRSSGFGEVQVRKIVLLVTHECVNPVSLEYWKFYNVEDVFLWVYMHVDQEL